MSDELVKVMQAEKGEVAIEVSFFDKPRGEVDKYKTCGIDEEVLMPLTKEGFEAFIERCVNEFAPPLPFDDSIRKVFAGYIHHIENEVNTITVRQISKVLYKSIANAMTWTMDQEVKARLQQQHNERLIKERSIAEEKAKQIALAKRAEKQERKSAKKLSLIEKNGDQKRS